MTIAPYKTLHVALPQKPLKDLQGLLPAAVIVELTTIAKLLPIEGKGYPAALIKAGVVGAITTETPFGPPPEAHRRRPACPPHFCDHNTYYSRAAFQYIPCAHAGRSRRVHMVLTLQACVYSSKSNSPSTSCSGGVSGFVPFNRMMVREAPAPPPARTASPARVMGYI